MDDCYEARNTALHHALFMTNQDENRTSESVVKIAGTFLEFLTASPNPSVPESPSAQD